MFSDRWNQDSSKEVLIEEITPQTFKKFLEFVYSDTFVVNVPEALELLQVAHKYDVQLLVEKCEQLLESNVTLDDAVDVFQAARKYDKTQLMHKVGDFLAKSLSRLPSRPSFSRMDKQTLVFILMRDDLKMKEVELFRLAMQWAKNQAGLAPQESLEDILPLIRFPIMALEEFTSTVVPTGLLSQSTLIGLFTYFGTDAETRKSLASSLSYSTQQRRYTDAMVSFALYLGDSEGAGISRNYFRQLKESLWFSTRYDCLQTQSSCGQPTTLNTGGIGLNGVTVYCPTWVNTTASRMVFYSFKEFKILVKARHLYAKDVGQEFEELFRLSPVKAKEGTTMDVTFDTSIPLENEMQYCISVEEINSRTSRWADGSSECYDAKYWDYQKLSATVIVGDTRLSLENIKKNYNEGSGGNAQPHLILKLSFKEF